MGGWGLHPRVANNHAARDWAPQGPVTGLPLLGDENPVASWQAPL